MTDRLVERARGLGREFRLKLSNTLVVRNHRSFFPPGEAVMYLSGAPLHVITLHLVERVRRARPERAALLLRRGRRRNFADCVALGLAPVTVCTDLLKPGGYGRLPKYLENLEERMRGLGVRNVRRLRGPGRRPGREQAVARRGGAGHGRSALPDGIAAPATQDRPAPRALRLHQLRQVPAGLPERRQLRLRDRAAREGVRELPRRGRPGRPRARAGASRCASATRSPPSRTSATTAATATRSAPRTAGPTSRSRASSARSRPGGSRPTRDGFFVETARARDAMWGRLRGVEYRLEVDRDGRPGRLHGRARDPRAAPPRAHAGRRVRRPRRARGPHAGRGRVPEDGRPARRRPRLAPRQPGQRLTRHSAWPAVVCSSMGASQVMDRHPRCATRR